MVKLPLMCPPSDLADGLESPGINQSVRPAVGSVQLGAWWGGGVPGVVQLGWVLEGAIPGTQPDH